MGLFTNEAKEARMTARTAPNETDIDQYGIERATDDEQGMVDKLRAKWGWFDHVMRMNERYSEMGGNHYAAGITYFSVLSLFPLLMLAFGIAGFVLKSRPELLQQIQDQIASSLSGQLGETINEVVTTAIDQASAVFSIGALTALWSGLGWMNNLRFGVSKQWKIDPTGGNFVMNKLRDLLGLLGLMLALALAFGVTAVGSSGLTTKILAWLQLDHVPGIGIITTSVAIVLGIGANFLVFFWLIKYMPRGKTPVKSAAQGALIGALIFEVFKQLGSMFFSNALSNPAGATFGPIIGIMVLLYFIWRILLYCSAWAATTEESLEHIKLPAPTPAVIRVRQDVTPQVSGPDTGTVLGIGAALGAVGSWAVGHLFKR